MDYIEFEKRYMEFTNKHDHVLWDKRESLGLFLDKVFVIDDGESIPQKEEDWDLAWSLFIDVYQHALNISEYKQYLEYFMYEHWDMWSMLNAVKYHDVKDAEKLKKLWAEDEVTVYRGGHDKDGLNISWTLNKDLAKWFATRFWCPEHMRGEDYRGLPVIHTGKIRGRDIALYLNTREEEECIIPMPDDFVDDLETQVLTEHVEEKTEHFKDKKWYTDA